jgi:hypothetical protein
MIDERVKHMRRLFLVLLLGISFAAGCNPTAASSSPKIDDSQTAEAQESSHFKPFVVYRDKGTRDNHFVPSGFMPNGRCLELLDTWQEKCYEGSSCIKISYDIECSRKDQGWAGIYWLNPANNWGSQNGGFNLAGAEKLTFWAKGEKGGERIEEFKMGGIAGDYPDSDSAIIGPVILDVEWRQYAIDLRGKDLSSISGGFSWATDVHVNPDGCIFYLDNIQYE